MTKLYHHILTCGSYLSTRVEGEEVIHLYAIDGIMVEVYFNPDSHHIHRIEVVGDYQIPDIWDFTGLSLN